MFTKFASAAILSAEMNGQKMVRKTAHRHEFTYDARPGYLYVRSRAISSRCNDNFDEFPAEEIKQSYATFIGKPVFVNHHNDNHRRARGVIIDAALHEDRAPDGSPDTWVEVLMEVDAVRFPKLAKAILAGHVDRTSMGTDVAFSKCGYCGNKASTPLEYCSHIPALKGKRIFRTTANGSKEGVLVREICYGLRFFENSLLVEEPADPTAYFLGVEAGPGVVGPKAVKVASRDELADRRRQRSDQQAHDLGNDMLDLLGPDAKTPKCYDLDCEVPQPHFLRDHIRPVQATSSYPLECYGCGETADGNSGHFGFGYSRSCPNCGSYEIHPPELGSPNPDWTEEDERSRPRGTSQEQRDLLNSIGTPEEHAFLQSNPTGPTKFSSLDVTALNNPYGDAYQPPLTPISNCKSCSAEKGTHCTRGCKGVRLYKGANKQVISATEEEIARLTDLPPLDLKGRGSNGHCKRCGAPLANSLESSVGLCPACEDNGGRRQPQRQRQKLVRTTDGRTVREGSLQKEAIPRNIAGWKERMPGEDPLEHISRVTSSPQAARYAGGPVPYYRNVNFQKNADGSHSVIHHNTEIMRFHPDGQSVTLNTGGWMSKGTRDLFHHFLNSDLSEDRRSFQIDGRTRRNGWEDASNPRFHPGGPWTVHTHGPAEEHPEYGFMRPGARQSSEEYHDGMTLNRVTGDHNHAHCFTPGDGSGRAGTFETDPASGAPAGGWDAETSRSFTRNRRSRQDWNGYGGASGLGQGGRGVSGDGLGYQDEYGGETGPRYRGLNDDERRELQQADRSRGYMPEEPEYGDTAHSYTAPRDHETEGNDEAPRPGESLEDWMRRVPSKPKFDNCPDCRGKGTVRERGTGNRTECSKCEGNGYLDSKGKPYNPENPQGLDREQDVRDVQDLLRPDPWRSSSEPSGTRTPNDHPMAIDQRRYGLGGDGPSIGHCDACGNSINVGSHGPTEVVSHNDGTMWHGHHAPEFAHDDEDPNSEPYTSTSHGRDTSSDAGLGVGHIWHNTACPAYRSLNGADCTCNNNPRTSMKHHALGETVAPRDVDTLRDEECPVCAEKDSYDGDTCQVCGFVKPPAMFMDPNTDVAKSVDLRKDNPANPMAPNGDPLTPGGNQANPMDPNAVDAQGMPNEVPGSGTPGTDAVPIDPNMVDENGNQIPGQNSPTQQVGPDGQPIIDPNTGLPLSGQSGPTDIYGQPLGPEGPLSVGEQQPVDQATGLPIDPVTGQPTDMAPLSPEQLQAQVPGEGMVPAQPGAQGQMPEGMAPDGQMEDPSKTDQNAGNLMCPNCGFTTVAAAPMSLEMPMGEPTGNVSDGAQVGDVCPECGQALLVSADQAQGLGEGGNQANEMQSGVPSPGGDEHPNAENGEAAMGDEEEETGQADFDTDTNGNGIPDADSDDADQDSADQDSDDDSDDKEPKDKKENPFGG